jgi:hypothetical protein
MDYTEQYEGHEHKKWFFINLELTRFKYYEILIDDYDVKKKDIFRGREGYDYPTFAQCWLPALSIPSRNLRKFYDQEQ